MVAVQSTSLTEVVIVIATLLLACVGLATVGRWLSSQLVGDPELGAAEDDRSQEEPVTSAPPVTPSRPAVSAPPVADTQPEAPQPEAAAAAGPETASAATRAVAGGGLAMGSGNGDRLAPAHQGARCEPRAHEVIGLALAVSRSIAGAEKLVARELSRLPGDRWHVEYGLLIPGYRIPFLILGERGVFMVWAAVGPLNWEHLLFAARAAVVVGKLLPGYEGEIRGAYCRALASEEVRPRLWVRPEPTGDEQHRGYRAGPGGWVMDRHWLVRWLESFDVEQGVGVKDLERIRVLALQRPSPSISISPTGTKLPFIDLVPNL